MAYVKTNPPRLVASSFDGLLPSEWYYNSADAASVVRVAGYFNNGREIGIKVGDIMKVRCSGTNVTTSHTVLSIAAIDATNPATSATGAADLSDGITIADATNSD